MNTSIFLLSQGQAIAEISIMLLVAFLLGLLLGWLLFRNKADSTAFKKENEKLLVKIGQLEEEIAKLKTDLEGAHQHEEELEVEIHKQEEILQRLAQRKHELDFDSFGRAEAHEKDDLKIIKGIGPFIEKKLNALDIYTFRQISNFSQKDIEKVTEVIEFFPGRIQRDHWVDQAKKLADERNE